MINITIIYNAFNKYADIDCRPLREKLQKTRARVG